MTSQRIEVTYSLKDSLTYWYLAPGQQACAFLDVHSVSTWLSTHEAGDCVGGVVYDFAPPPVGGLVEPVEKVSIVSPWLAVIGLVAMAATVVVAKKRRP